ncbi:MAG: Nif3-like dinuclear metal center hexameric protein [Bacteroidales bacterium]|nr:Nif3-like dinuclear metal center hexameric protein [Bacteroidales bacterium]
MKVKEITSAIEKVAPLYLQESYDNAGMQVGDPDSVITGVVLCTDVRESIVDEAIACGANLIISHHPLIFRGIKKLTGRDYVERIVMKAIRHGVSIYSAHTNLDNARGGVSYKMAEKLGMTGVQVLDAQQGTQRKIVVFVPKAQAAQVEQAMWSAGAGVLGDYDRCSYRLEGEGRFHALEGANPFAGEVGEDHVEAETRVEVLVNKARCSAVIAAMLKAHPYEEPAFDVIPLENEDRYSGSGVIGDIEEMDGKAFLLKLKEAFGVATVRFSGHLDRKVKRVALCGGAGSFLAGKAMAMGADAYVTGDMKYHEFQGNEHRIILADIGHWESEQFTKEIFASIIAGLNPDFPVNYAKEEQNQIQYI